MISFTPSDINIASQPFRQERAQNALLAGVGIVLSVSLLVLFMFILHEKAQVADLARVLGSQRSQLAGLQSAQAQYSTILAKPGNAGVFSESVLLNELIARRAVSWTKVFEDLGTVLPTNMRLLSIRLPQVAGEDGAGRNRVELDMWVGTEQPAAVLALLRKMEASQLFGAASVMTQSPPSQNDPLYKYRLTVAYAQQL